MAGIVEAQEAEAEPPGFSVKRARLGRVHVGAIAAEPDQGGRSASRWPAAAKSDTSLIRGIPDHDHSRLFVRHARSVPMLRLNACASTWVQTRAGFAGRGGLAEPGAAVNRAGTGPDAKPQVTV